MAAKEALPLRDDQPGPFVFGGVILVQVCKSVLLVCFAIKVLPTKQKDFTLHKATCQLVALDERFQKFQLQIQASQQLAVQVYSGNQLVSHCNMVLGSDRLTDVGCAVKEA